MLCAVSLTHSAISGSALSGVEGLTTPSLSARVPEGPYHIGDDIPLTVTLRVPKDLRCEIPSHVVLDPFVIKKFEKTSVLEGDDIRTSLSFALTAFTVGTVRVPPITVEYTGPDGQPAGISTPEVPVTILSLLTPEITDIKGIKRPVSIMEKDYSLVETGGGFLAIALAFFLAHRYLRRPRAAAAAIPAPALSPEEIALMELDAVEAAGLPEKGLWKEYYSGVSDALRRYIGARWGIIAMEMTTAEILSVLKEPGMGERLRTPLRHVLTEADLVKFAKFIPVPEQAKAALKEARVFVKGGL